MSQQQIQSTLPSLSNALTGLTVPELNCPHRIAGIVDVWAARHNIVLSHELKERITWVVSVSRERHRPVLSPPDSSYYFVGFPLHHKGDSKVLLTFAPGMGAQLLSCRLEKSFAAAEPHYLARKAEQYVSSHRGADRFIAANERWWRFSGPGRTFESAPLYEKILAHGQKYWRSQLTEELREFFSASRTSPIALGRRSEQLKELANDLSPLYDFEIHKAIAHLGPVIHTEAFRALWVNRCFQFEAYNTAVAGPNYETHLRRARWIATFPFFVPWVIPERQHLITNNVDSNESFAEVAAHELACERALIHRLKNISQSSLAFQYSENYLTGSSTSAAWIFKKTDLVQIAVSGFGSLPLHHIPVFSAKIEHPIEQAAISTLLSSHSFARVLIDNLYGPHKDLPSLERIKKDVFLNLMRSSQGNWRQSSNDVPEKPIEEIKHSTDFLKAAASALLLPQVLLELWDQVPQEVQKDTENVKILSSVLFSRLLSSGFHISKILEHSRDWHTRFQNGERGVGPSDLSWPELCPEQKAPNGCILHPLTDAQALKLEGFEMRHCVGGYSTLCASSGNHIFSIRASSGERLSTLTVRESCSPTNITTFANVQNLAAGNDPSPSPAREAAAWLISELNEGNIVPDLQRIQSARQEFNANKFTIAFCGFDARDAEARKDAYFLYRPYLPTALQASSVDEFTSLPLVRNEIEQMKSFIQVSGSATR